MSNDLVFGMAGSGGDGIVSAGESLIAAAARDGYNGIMTKSFGSQIRGGESSCRVRIANHPCSTPGDAGRRGRLELGRLPQVRRRASGQRDTIVVYESATGVAPDKLPLGGVKPTQVFAVPIEQMAKKAANTDKAKNSVVLGLLSGWFGSAASRS